jgi:hypothetical protein
MKDAGILPIIALLEKPDNIPEIVAGFQRGFCDATGV